MALIKKLIRMKKRKGSDIILSYPQTVDENVLCDNETVTLKAKVTNLQSSIDGKASAAHTHNYAGASSAGGAATSALTCSGNSATATTLATSRTVRTNLASTSQASFNGSADITPGVTGTLPVTNGGTGAVTVNAAAANLGVSSPNLLINADFKIWQRGSSFTAPSNAYTADRWQCNGSGTVVKDSGGMKVTGSVNLKYTLEADDFAKISGKTVTLSYSKDGSITTSTFIASSASVVNMTLSSGVYNWFKLESGSVATPFAPRSYTEEILLCQRYYKVFGNGTLRVMAFLAGGTFRASLPLELPMRTSPTAIAAPPEAFSVFTSGGGRYYCDTMSLFPSSKYLYINFKLASADQAYYSNFSSSLLMSDPSGYIYLDAEIY